MRFDYALYALAIISFILTGVILTYQVEFKELFTVTTVVLGLLFIGLGYFQRPRATAATTKPPIISTAPVTVMEKKTEPSKKVTPRATQLTRVKGIVGKRAQQLKALNINDVEDLANASAKDLATILRISQKVTSRWIENAKELSKKS